MLRWVRVANSPGISFPRTGRSVGRLAARIDVHTSRNDQYAALTFSQLGSVAAAASLRVRIRMTDMMQVLR